MARARTVSVVRPELGVHEGLAYALFTPEGQPRGSILILHGAGSTKESHFDFARAALTYRFAALAFDLRGHGDSEGVFGSGVLDDIGAMAGLLPAGPLALRGSSLGGYLALVGAERTAARAVIAICPAGAGQLRRGLRSGELAVDGEHDALDAFLSEHDEMLAAAQLEAGLLLLHAEGDERVGVEQSRELERAAERADPKRLIVVPGGHHRSIQHDAELQGVALLWLEQALAR